MAVLDKKIPPPIVFFVCAFAMYSVSDAMPGLVLPAFLRALVFVALLVVGGYAAISAVLQFKSASTTVDPRKPETASELVTGGVFRWSRNPMYFGMACVLGAWGVFLLSIWGFAVLAGFVWYINRFQIEPEERALEQKFGEAYAAYCARVRRWI